MDHVRLFSVSCRVASEGLELVVSGSHDDDADIDYGDAAWALAKRVDIRPSSDKSFRAAMLHRNQVVGALFTGVSGGAFSFDVVVDPDHRGGGVGRQLIDLAIEEYKDLRDQYMESGDDLAFEVQVVNPRLVDHLKKRGFEVDEDRPAASGVYMVPTRRL